MELIARTIGAFLLVVAIVVVVQAVVPGDRHDLWTYINPLMAASIVLVVAFSAFSAWTLRRSGGAADAAPSRSLFDAGFICYVGLFIAYLFFLNWIKELDEGEGYGWVWIVLNGMIPVLNVWAGVRLWTRRWE